MLKISTRSTYGIKALLFIYNSDYVNKTFTIKTIAEKGKIPYRYLEQIFRKLRIGGFVESVRGPGGGYRVSKKPKEITLSDLVNCLEGQIKPILCLESKQDDKSCEKTRDCACTVLCRDLDESVNGVLRKFSMADLIKVGLAGLR